MRIEVLQLFENAVEMILLVTILSLSSLVLNPLWSIVKLNLQMLCQSCKVSSLL